MKKLLVLAALCGFFYAQNSNATCSNPASYVDGNTLTAGELNTDFGLVATCVDDVLNGDTFTGNLSIHSGFDLLMYSDTGTTLKASIDGATGATIAGLTQAGQVTNCGISVSGSTFTIAGYDGTALSATNPCVVAVRSNTAGRVALAYFTSNVTFTFGAASDTDGNLFGITDANWANVMPFFLGVVYDGTTPYFTISRVPNTKAGGANTDLCQKGDTDCDGESDIMILSTGLTVSSFTGLPITQVGWFEMTYSTTNSAWTVPTLVRDIGFNSNFESINFTMAAAQMGAVASSFVYSNAGTEPDFSGRSVTYRILKSGITYVSYYFSGDGGADGVGANTIDIVTPYTASETSGYCPIRVDSNTTSYLTYFYFSNSSPHLMRPVRPAISGTNLTNGAISTFLNTDFVNGDSRLIEGNCTYRVSIFTY